MNFQVVQQFLKKKERYIYCKSTIKPPEGFFFQAHLRREGRGFIETGGLFEKWGRGLFHLEETMVSVLYKKLEYKVEKVKCKKVGGLAVKDQNQIWTSGW